MLCQGLPIPLSLISPWAIGFPFLIFAVIVAVLAILAAIRFRRRHPERKILTYAVIASILILLVISFDYVSRPVIVEYRVDTGSGKLFTETMNQFSLISENHGSRGMSFYLVINCIGASFPTQQDNILVNSRTLKVPFDLSINGFGLDSQSKNVFFTIDRGVSSFSFSIHLEQSGFGWLMVGSATTSISGIWNTTENRYTYQSMGGFDA